MPTDEAKARARELLNLSSDEIIARGRAAKEAASAAETVPTPVDDGAAEQRRKAWKKPT